MQKIGVFGGSFNPIHNGHIALCNVCSELYRFDRVLLIPSNIPPHKSSRALASGKDRYAMAELAAIDINGAEASDIELSAANGKKSYTILTLEALKLQYPDAELFLIIGSDMLFSFDTWYRYNDILKLATLLAGARIGDNHTRGKMLYAKERILKNVASLGEGDKNSADKRLFCNIEIVDFDTVEISSTLIREAIRTGREADIKKYLSTPIYNYIKQNRLYLQ